MCGEGRTAVESTRRRERAAAAAAGDGWGPAPRGRDHLPAVTRPSASLAATGHRARLTEVRAPAAAGAGSFRRRGRPHAATPSKPALPGPPAAQGCAGPSRSPPPQDAPPVAGVLAVCFDPDPLQTSQLRRGGCCRPRAFTGPRPKGELPAPPPARLPRSGPAPPRSRRAPGRGAKPRAPKFCPRRSAPSPPAPDSGSGPCGIGTRAGPRGRSRHGRRAPRSRGDAGRPPAGGAGLRRAAGSQLGRRGPHDSAPAGDRAPQGASGGRALGCPARCVKPRRPPRARRLGLAPAPRLP